MEFTNKIIFEAKFAVKDYCTGQIMFLGYIPS